MRRSAAGPAPPPPSAQRDGPERRHTASRQSPGGRRPDRPSGGHPAVQGTERSGQVRSGHTAATQTRVQESQTRHALPRKRGQRRGVCPDRSVRSLFIREVVTQTKPPPPSVTNETLVALIPTRESQLYTFELAMRKKSSYSKTPVLPGAFTEHLLPPHRPAADISPRAP